MKYRQIVQFVFFYKKKYLFSDHFGIAVLYKCIRGRLILRSLIFKTKNPLIWLSPSVILKYKYRKRLEEELETYFLSLSSGSGFSITQGYLAACINSGMFGKGFLVLAVAINDSIAGSSSVVSKFKQCDLCSSQQETDIKHGV